MKNVFLSLIGFELFLKHRSLSLKSPMTELCAAVETGFYESTNEAQQQQQAVSCSPQKTVSCSAAGIYNINIIKISTISWYKNAQSTNKAQYYWYTEKVRSCSPQNTILGILKAKESGKNGPVSIIIYCSAWKHLIITNSCIYLINVDIKNARSTSGAQPALSCRSKHWRRMKVSKFWQACIPCIMIHSLYHNIIVLSLYHTPFQQRNLYKQTVKENGSVKVLTALHSLLYHNTCPSNFLLPTNSIIYQLCLFHCYVTLWAKFSYLISMEHTPTEKRQKSWIFALHVCKLHS